MNELLENSLNFDRISFAHVSELISLISNTQKHDIPYLKERYARSSQNFEETLAFLKLVGIVEELEGLLQVEHEYTGLAEDELKNKLLQALFKSSKRDLSEFHEYLENFVEVDGTYSFSPSLEKNIYTSGLRNLLIQLGFIQYIDTTSMYVTTERGKSLLSGRQRKLTAQSLAAILRSQERLGAAAEDAVIAYENELLAPFPDLVPLIRHVALEDVGAGYDIYSVRPARQGSHDDRYIEVKAVSRDNDFYWSINEINTAKAYGTKYYLYLVPVMGSGNFDIQNMNMIQDPYRSLFEREEVRVMESVSFHVQPKHEFLERLKARYP